MVNSSSLRVLWWVTWERYSKYFNPFSCESTLISAQTRDIGFEVPWYRLLINTLQFSYSYISPRVGVTVRIQDRSHVKVIGVHELRDVRVDAILLRYSRDDPQASGRANPSVRWKLRRYYTCGNNESQYNDTSSIILAFVYQCSYYADTNCSFNYTKVIHIS